MVGSYFAGSDRMECKLIDGRQAQPGRLDRLSELRAAGRATNGIFIDVSDVFFKNIWI